VPLVRNYLLPFIFLIILSSNIFADPKVLRVTGHPDYPPVIWYSEKEDKLKGVAVELLQNIFKDSDIKLEFQHVATWGRALEEVNQGRIDMLLPPYKTEERKIVYHFSDQPFMEDRTVLFLKKGSKVDYKELVDLSKYQGTAIINDSFGDDFDKASKKLLKVQRLSKTEQCLRFLLRGRADYLVAGYSAGISVAKAMGVDNQIEVHKMPIIRTGMYIALSKRSKHASPEIMKLIDIKLVEYQKSGFIKELEKKYDEIYQRE